MTGKTKHLKWNRRSFKYTGKDPEDNESTYAAVSFKFKNKQFARPIILINKMAEDWMMESFRKNGWFDKNL